MTMEAKTILFCCILFKSFIAGIAGQKVTNDIAGLYHYLRSNDFDNHPNCLRAMTAKMNDGTQVGYRIWDTPTGCGVSELTIMDIHPDGSFETYGVNIDGSRGRQICQVAANDRQEAGNISKATRKCNYGNGVSVQIACLSRKSACELTESDKRDLESLCPTKEFATVPCDKDNCN